MTIHDTILTQLQYAKELTAEIKDVSVYDPTEEYIGLYWCGRQALETTKMFCDTLAGLGVITQKQQQVYAKMRIEAEENLQLQRARLDVYRGDCYDLP